MSVHTASRIEEEEEEEKWLNVALFATQCVEKVDLSSDRYNKGRKKRPPRLAPHSSNKDKLTLITCENKRKRDLWNADAELIVWNNLSFLIGHFERHLWLLVPLHPSVLQEDNVRFALMGQQSERMEDFPLLFNVNVAMACALKLVGHKQREEEFIMRARHHLEYLFDSSHIEIAEGLLCMAYCSFCQAQLAQYSYYLTLARNILRRLDAFGSDVYSRVLWCSIADPVTAIEEKQSILCEFTNNVDSHQPYQSAPMTTVDMDLAKSIFKMLSACRLMVELKKSTTSHTPYSPEADKSFFFSLAFVIAFLQQLVNQWKRRGTVTFVLGVELSLLATRLVYHHLRQDDDQALYWAAQYTKLVQERAADMQHMPALHLPSFKMVADLLVQTGKWRLLKLMLAAAHGWTSSHPITLLHAESYQQQLAINFDRHSNNDDDEKEEEEEEESEDAAEGLETGSPTWWASQVISGRRIAEVLLFECK